MAHADWIEEEMIRIYTIYQSTQEEKVNNFYTDLRLQCSEASKKILLSFESTALFEILSSGYEQECNEAAIINNFTNDLQTRLGELKKNIADFGYQIKSTIYDPFTFPITFGSFISECKNIKDVLINIKLREFQQSQTLPIYVHRTKHNIKNLQHVFLELITLCDQLNQILAVNKLNSFDNKGYQMQPPFNKGTPYQQSVLTSNLENDIDSIKVQLVASSFIVEDQPPQVIHTKTKFAVGIRCLLGKLYLGSNSKTTCYILSEQQAKQFISNPNQCLGKNLISGVIANHTSTFEQSSDRSYVQAKFRNMKLKKIIRSRTDAMETDVNVAVSDQKFTFLFLNVINGNSLQIRGWSMSLPVVVTSHVHQDPQSWATITWDNSFSNFYRLPFEVPESVTWDQLSSTLNQKFMSFTEKSLTSENLLFLYRMLFPYDERNEQISWSRFCKKNLLQQKFTFWEWFYSTMKLVNSPALHNHWKTGKIIGFISKENAQNILLNQPNGTFLIRFSESSLGAITVNFKQNDRIIMIQPWTLSDLIAINLDIRIRDLHEDPHLIFKWLYDFKSELTPVVQAFPNYDKKTDNDYVPWVVTVRI